MKIEEARALIATLVDSAIEAGQSLGKGHYLEFSRKGRQVEALEENLYQKMKPVFDEYKAEREEIHSLP